MERTFSFGKVAYYGKRRENLQEIKIVLRNTEKGPEFSAMADIWNRTHTDILAGGQCIDEIKGSSKVLKEIKRLWKLYHLNGMNAGTIEQDKAIEDSKADGTWETCQKRLDEQKAKDYPYSKPTASHYEVACEVLKEKGKYEVKLEDGTDYEYGHSWLYRAIPEEDLMKIKLLLDGSKTKEELNELL